MEPKYYIRFYYADSIDKPHFRIFDKFRTALADAHHYRTNNDCYLTYKNGLVMKVVINQITVYDTQVSDKFIPALLVYNKELDENFIKDIYGKLHLIAW